ncbi:hypothetical protein CVT24_012905 [Panaeolus cyanescens]|uniref:DUF5648 domain-containing protein n=1 Tax=Panaeolus cyanescens TaxID=181874 RepID=A0A409W2R4_9AGAR|nr:hypothetical protein CVT24_012905 [Panaeolus cyanescens]
MSADVRNNAPSITPCLIVIEDLDYDATLNSPVSKAVSAQLKLLDALCSVARLRCHKTFQIRLLIASSYKAYLKRHFEGEPYRHITTRIPVDEYPPYFKEETDACSDGESFIERDTQKTLNVIRGVVDLPLSSYVVIMFLSLTITFLTTVLTAKDGPLGGGGSILQTGHELSVNQTWDILKSAVVEEAFSTPSKTYLRSKEQEDKLYHSIKSIRSGQEKDWPILWVNGHVEQRTQERTTDLMQILSRRLAVDGHLAATYFCTSSTRGFLNWSAELHLIPTLAYQLAKSRPGTQPHIVAALQAHPKLLEQPARVQFDHLIKTPLLKDFLLGTFISDISPGSNASTSSPPTYFLIDAFHRCGSAAFQTEILHAISRLVSAYKGPPLTFIIGSSVTQTLSVNFFAHQHLALHTKSLIIDSSADDATILAGASLNPTPLLLRHAYSPIGQDHFYTVDSDEFVQSQHIAYRPLQLSHNPHHLQLYNAIGGVYSTSVPHSIPLYRLFNIGTGDHHYTTDLREVGDAINVGYELECITGFVLEKHGQPAMVNVSMGIGMGDRVVRYPGGGMAAPWELRRMWSGGKRDHVLLTDATGKEGPPADGYVDEGVIGRLVPLF